MILSGRDIEWYVQQGKLKIDPIEPSQYRENGIDLVLEDVKQPDWVERPENFMPTTFYLGSTRETLRLPDDLMAFVELRSTWARSGLILPPTIVDAGFEGNLTLEIAAFRYLKIPYGERFAHLIFAKLSSPGVPYRGKYQGQSGVTAARQDKK